MQLPTFCIKRPVFATVLSLLLVVIGILGYQNLHTRFFPRFAQNRITILTTYNGASANLVETSITTPLEKAISGVEGIDYTTSTSNQGVSNITVMLTPGTNIFDATNKIRNQVAMATPTLPHDIQAPIVEAGHGEMDLIDIGFSADGNDLNQLRDYLDRNVITQIEQQPGISEVDVLGANKYAMRIALDPNQMNLHQVSVADIGNAIQNSNLELPAGSIQSPTMDFPITAKTTLHTADEFGNIAIRKTNNQIIRLKDVATVTLGNDTSTQSIIRINGKPGILLSVYNTDSANPIDASKNVKALLQSISAQLPSSIHYTVTFDQSDFMNASISEVYKSIVLAILFVAVIIYLSLGKMRSALIPVITIPICILATMGLMYFLGFSINIITLLAIVLSIGLVVDDAIVVLENIHRHIENGLSKMEAAIQGSKEIATPVIGMTLTLAAVYAPIGLIKGPVSHIFASFAFTLAAAVIISGFVALTLSPMMCSKFLGTHDTHRNKLNERINYFFEQLTHRYQTILKMALSHRLKTIVATITLTVFGFMIASSLPKTFMPNEDMGFLITLLNSSAGVNKDYAENQLQAVNQQLLKNNAIQTTVSLSLDQAGSKHNNMIFSTLKSYDDRDSSAQQLANIVNKQLSAIAGLNTVSFAPSFGGSLHSEVAFYIMAPLSYQQLYQVGNHLIQQLSGYTGLKDLANNIQFNNQQYSLTVNRNLADDLQVPVRSIDETVADLLGGNTISTIDLDGQSYDVDIQAAKPFLQSIQGINQFAAPAQNGQFIPLANLISMTPVPMQTDLFHYNRLRAAEITAEIAPGYTLGQVVSYLQNNLSALLPNQVKYAFTGQAQRVVSSSNSMLSIFLLAFVFIYLVLSAQFESFIDPLIILLAVPLSIVGALISLKCVGGSINLYTMIGLVTLVGLIAKHGILITQFANTLQQSGENTQDALIHAATIRLRPILMTTAAMVCGALPLLFASGASAISREQIGTVFVGGLLFGTFFSLIVVPVAYSCFNQLKQYAKNSIVFRTST